MRTPVAGIVAFNPEAALVDLCTALRAQGCEVLVYDNGSREGVALLDACEAEGATVIRAAANTGVAGGLAGLLAQAGNAEWLLTFDQDSKVPDGFVDALTRCPALTDPQVAIVAPLVIENANGKTVQGRTQETWHYVRRVITSGAMCRVDALNSIGGFREGLFIDYVDYDVCLRLKRAAWRLVIEPGAVLHHSIGAQTAPKLLGLVPITTSNHSPDRVYYKYRNYVLLCRDRTMWADPSAAVWDGLALAWGPLKILLLEQQKRAKLAAIASGVVHGLAGRGGPRG